MEELGANLVNINDIDNDDVSRLLISRGLNINKKDF